MTRSCLPPSKNCKVTKRQLIAASKQGSVELERLFEKDADMTK